MVTLLVALAVLGILFGAAALATYEGDVLRDPHPDDRPATLPTTALQPEDVSELRFDMAVRGYRMSEVDEVLHRVAQELADRDARIVELEDALAEPHPAVEEPSAPEPVAPQEFAPLEPPSAAPAVASGPLTATTWWADDPTAAPVPVEAAALEEPLDEPGDEPGDEPVEEEPDALEAVEAPVEEQTYEPPQEQPEDEEPAALDVPATVPEPPALTLPAADDAFSFPELQLPEPAIEEPVETVEPSTAPAKDWWTSLQEPPSGEGPARG